MQALPSPLDPFAGYVSFIIRILCSFNLFILRTTSCNVLHTAKHRVESLRMRADIAATHDISLNAGMGMLLYAHL